MDMRLIEPRPSAEMSLARLLADETAPRAANPLRRVARAFAVPSIVAAFYALAIVGVAVRARVIEF